MVYVKAVIAVYILSWLVLGVYIIVFDDPDKNVRFADSAGELFFILFCAPLLCLIGTGALLVQIGIHIARKIKKRITSR